MKEKLCVRRGGKKALLAVFIGLCFLSVWIAVCFGAKCYHPFRVWQALFFDDGSEERLIVWNLRLPRVVAAGLVGVCLSLSGCILQGVMRNHLASPSTIGVTSGASFLGYLTLVAFPSLSFLLPIGSILGAFVTTMLIYLLAYRKGASPVKMILAGLAVSALFGALSDTVKTLFAENVGNVSAFLVGGLNGVVWEDCLLVLPYAMAGALFCLLLPSKMNILMLGDETASSLGLHTERFRFLLICISSLLAGASIAVAGLVGFVGLIVPHIARLIVGADYRFLFPASASLGFLLLVLCDTVGRVIVLPAEIPVGILLSLIGAPFFLFLLRTREKE